MKYFSARLWNILNQVVGKLGLAYNNQFNVPILIYHSVNPEPNASLFRISPERFEEQIRLLTMNYKVITFSELVDSIKQKNILEKSAIITFDDGYKDNYSYAFPILKKYNCPVVIFVATGFIEKQVELYENEVLIPLSWNEIREMEESSLITFGSHGHSHKPMSSLSADEIRNDILTSKKILENHLKQKIDLFAFPNGQMNDIGKYAVDILKEHGFRAACTTLRSTINSKKKLFYINRVLIDRHDDLKKIELKLNGGYNYMWFIHHAKYYLSKLLHLIYR